MNIKIVQFVSLAMFFFLFVVFHRHFCLQGRAFALYILFILVTTTIATITTSTMKWLTVSGWFACVSVLKRKSLHKAYVSILVVNRSHAANSKLLQWIFYAFIVWQGKKEAEEKKKRKKNGFFRLAGKLYCRDTKLYHIFNVVNFFNEISVLTLPSHCLCYFSSALIIIEKTK